LALLEKFTVERVVDNGRPGDDVVATEMAALRAYTAKLGRRYHAVVDLNGKAIHDDVVDPLKCRAVDPKIRVLSGSRAADPGWGEDRFHHRFFDNENNHSVVVRVDFGESSLLVTGDLEETALKDLVAAYGKTGLLDVDAYHVGHHGSANGTTQELLDAMTPDVALISMGDAARRLDWTAWQYGHPRQKVVDLLEGEVRLKRAAVDVQVGTGQRRFEKVRVERAVYATGWEGSVVVDMAADGRLRVRPTERYVDDGAK
jgi:competence protein ComEC